MNQSLSIAKKELKAYFGSPMAAIFIGAFLLSVFFSFFWLDAFFSRNTADIRPLFRWMPLLMIFLTAALTMRQWSEEQKMGTMEILLTLPVKLPNLVWGKFLAVLGLVGLALAFTLGLPLTVSMMGNIDWGPVVGGYFGALLMASAYIAIGLFISSRTDNQIVALLIKVLVCAVFYLIGSAGITNFLGNEAGEFLRRLGTGSRFESIERGVIDLRDLLYYGSLTVLFLLLNVLSLDSKRWGKGACSAVHRRTAKLGVVLIAANLLAMNVWAQGLSSWRLDLTENREYSLSQTTRDMLDTLQEPLVLRGYFSEKTHPLLAPLVPRIRDFMKEYEIAGHGRVQVSFVDPKYDAEAEAEANQQYGIKPVPFQVAGRYEASVVNSYFNILVKYGDQYVTLGFDDLVEVRPRPDGQLDVGLRNFEYDLTKSIKKTVYGFQGVDTVFARINKKLELTAVVTPQTLPKALGEMPARITQAAGELIKESDGKLKYTVIDPDDPASGLGREAVNQRFGITPLRGSLFSDVSFYLHLFLTVGDATERIYLSSDMGAAEIRQEIEAAVKRTSSGFLKTVGIWTPPPAAAGYPPQRGQYQAFQQVLRENYNVETVDLKDGMISSDIDVLLLVAPRGMTDIERLAIDQYMMRGGSVVALAGRYQLDLPPGTQSLSMKEAEGGIGEMLAHYGVRVDKSLVMDKQNEPFPVPVTRDLGGITVQEIKRIDYPFFVDVRDKGMNRRSPAVASLPAVTLNWVSPLTMDRKKLSGRTATTLLQSSPQAWLSHDTNIQPDFERYPEYGFPVGDEMNKRTLAVALTGSFPSFFAGKEDPRLTGKKNDAGGKKAGMNTKTEKNSEDKAVPLAAILQKSPDSSRLVVVGSSEFISDVVLSIGRSMGQDRFLNNLEFLQNIIDWSVEDESLLAIRSRGSHARLLKPMGRREQAFWEWLNYGLALAALVVVSWYGNRKRRREKPMILKEAVS